MNEPYIPFSRLKELRKIADREIATWTAKDIWLFLVRQEIERINREKLIIEINLAYQKIARYEMIIQMYEGDSDE